MVYILLISIGTSEGIGGGVEMYIPGNGKWGVEWIGDSIG
jgi:hypothetical protein